MSRGRTWGPAEDATVKRMAQAGYSDAEIAEHMGRDRDLIGRHRRGMGITRGLSPALTAMMARINARRALYQFEFRSQCA